MQGRCAVAVGCLTSPRAWCGGVAGGQRRGYRRGSATETDKRTDAVPAVTSFPLARQNGRTIDRASTDERVSPSQTSANNVQKQCPRRQNGRLERVGRLRTGHRRFRRHTVSKTGGFPPHTDGQGCEGLFSHLPAVLLLSCGGGVTFFPSTHPCTHSPASPYAPRSLRARLPTAHPFHSRSPGPQTAATAATAEYAARLKMSDARHGQPVPWRHFGLSRRTRGPILMAVTSCYCVIILRATARQIRRTT